MTDSHHHHILSQFESDLRRLREAVLAMASQAQENLAHAIRGLLERDVELCHKTISQDDEVDDLEKRIDHQGMMIIVKYSPVARDLRRVVSTMKIAQALERVSDQASNIAKRAKKIAGNPEIPETAAIQPLYDLVSGLLRDAITAFSDGDVAVARQLSDRDEEVDKLHKALSKKLMKRLEVDSTHVQDYVDILFAVRFLERIGDYAVNIGEDAVYSESAVDIRHPKKTPGD